MLNTIKKSFAALKRNKSNIHIIVVVIAVVMIWRGVRGILDKILFPNYPIVSYLVGIVIGIVLLLIDNNKLDELDHH